jgi:elongation factor 3
MDLLGSALTSFRGGKLTWMRRQFNVWIPRERLIELGFSKIVQQFDDFEASREGSGSRELSGTAVRQHLADIGLDSDIAEHNEMRGLSGGQKVKVVLAAALWSKPQVLILDEPTNFLDRDALGGLATAIRDWSGAFVCISHNQEFIGALCPGSLSPFFNVRVTACSKFSFVEIWQVENGRLTHKGKAATIEDAFDMPASKASSRLQSRVNSPSTSNANSPAASAPTSGAEDNKEKTADGIPMPVVKKKKKTRKQLKEQEVKCPLALPFSLLWLTRTRVCRRGDACGLLRGCRRRFLAR